MDRFYECIFSPASRDIDRVAKDLQTVYLEGVGKGLLPSFKHGAILLYTLSTGFVLFCGAMQPHSIRKGYWNFLAGLTGQKFVLVSSLPLPLPLSHAKYQRFPEDVQQC